MARIHSWLFNNDLTDFDSTADLTAEGGAAFASGLLSQAISLDGTDDGATVSAPVDLNFGSNDFSYGGWFRASTLVDFAFVLGVGKRSGTDPNCFQIQTRNSGGWKVRVFMATGTLTGAIDFFSTGTILASTWYHAIVTRSKTNNRVRLYINGSLDTEVADGTNNYSVSSHLIGIGRTGEVGSPGTRFNGLIDHQSVWDHELTLAEVKYWYNSGLGTESFASCPLNDVHAWKLNGNADDSVASANGTLQGGAAYGTGPTNLGQCISLDGTDDCITVPRVSLSTSFGLNPFSISVWFNPSVMTSPFPSGAGFAVIAMDGRGSSSLDNRYGFYILPNGSIAGLVQTNTTNGQRVTITSAPGLVVAGQWYHAVLTRSVGNLPTNGIRLYLNNNLVGSANDTTGLVSQEGPSFLGIGRSGSLTDTPGYFPGLIDQVNIYSVELDATQVSDLYNSGNGLECPASNTAPTVGTATIQTSPIYNDTTPINARVSEFNDAESGTVDLTWKLYKNLVEIKSVTENGIAVSPGSPRDLPGGFTGFGTITAGDSITCTVTVDDGSAQTTSAQSVAVLVSNRDETIAAVPDSPYTLTKDVAITPIAINVGDPDGDIVTLSLQAGSLPTGLSFSQTLPYAVAAPYTVNITGTPTVSGPFSVTLQVSDAIGLTYQKVLNFTVTEPSDIVNQFVVRLIGTRFSSHVR